MTPALIEFVAKLRECASDHRVDAPMAAELLLEAATVIERGAEEYAAKIAQYDDAAGRAVLRTAAIRGKHERLKALRDARLAAGPREAAVGPYVGALDAIDALIEEAKS